MLDAVQQTLVEQNHNLIYSFAKRRNLDLEEYYDLLAIALCEAAEAYQKGENEFSTFAYACMKNKVNDYWRSSQTQKSIPNDKIVSYDVSEDKDDESSSYTYLNVMSDENRTCEDTIFGIQYRDMLERMNSMERTIVQYLMNDMKLKDIAIKLGVDVHKVSRTREKLKKQYRKMWN